MFYRAIAAAAALVCLSATVSAKPPPVGTIATGIKQVLFCHTAGDSHTVGQAFKRDMVEGAVTYQTFAAAKQCGKIATLKPAIIVNVEDIGVSADASIHLWIIEIADTDEVLPNIWLVYGEMRGVPEPATFPGREA